MATKVPPARGGLGPELLMCCALRYFCVARYLMRSLESLESIVMKVEIRVEMTRLASDVCDIVTRRSFLTT